MLDAKSNLTTGKEAEEEGEEAALPPARGRTGKEYSNKFNPAIPPAGGRTKKEG